MQTLERQSKILNNNINIDKIMNQIDFPVELRELHHNFTDQYGNTNTLTVPNRKAIVNVDTGAVMDIVSDQYKVVTHKEALEPVLAALYDGGFSFTRTALYNDGQRLNIEATNKNTEYRVGDDVFFPRVQVLNSYDRTVSVKVIFGLFRLVCSNGMVIPAKDENGDDMGYSFNQKHKGTVNTDISIWSEYIKSTDVFSKYTNYLESLDTRVPKHVAQEILMQLMNTKDRDHKAVLDILHKAQYGEGQEGLEDNLTKLNVLHGLTQHLRDKETRVSVKETYGHGRSSLFNTMNKSNGVIEKAQQLLVQYN